ncbi:hypothetical protein FRB96_007458 [Tulasnella sp. 330]|nr:hypothetical protein FRB96_007458 [Tulasnella sp. 330]KAG8883416.1 hypothetical protein FRB97_006698 [Tulasnella sp. 331]
MPVTQKASGVAANEPVSRASSTTSTPSSKKKNGASPAVNGPSATPAPKESISKAKGKDATVAREFVDPPKVIKLPSKKSTSGLWASVSYTIMVGLVTYTVVICPHDKKNDLPLCRAKTDVEHYWDRYIYEPLVQPRLYDLYALPSVQNLIVPIIPYAKPYAKQVQVFLDQRGRNVYRNYLTYSTLAEQELRHHSQPYVKQLQQHYDTHLDPFVSQYINPSLKQAEVWGRATGQTLEPYFYQAATTLSRAMHETEPAFAVLWSYAADVPGVVHKRAWEPLVDLRRTYVDPQVSKMMETVDEVGGDAKVAADEHITAPAAEAGETVDKADDTPSETVVSELPTPTPTPTVSESLIEDEVTLTSDLPDQSTASIVESSEEDADLEAFLFELEADTRAAQAAAEPKAPHPTDTEDPEEVERRRVQRDIDTANKRADIMERHANWERQLQLLSDARFEAFPETLELIRAQEVSELANAKHADTLAKDADKSLKNVDAFGRKLASEDGKTLDSKVVLLEGIVNKVQKRFDDGATAISGQVDIWVQNARQKESDEIERLATEVFDVGTMAQGNLALDYTWLDDVTVADWKRYHALYDASTDLRTKLTNLASGSDPRSPRDAVPEVTRDLQLELETIALRFRSDLNAVHQHGLELIRGGQPLSEKTHHATVSSGEPVMSILPIDDAPADQTIDPQNVLLGKSKEQVEEAMAWRVADDAGEHPEL